MIFTRLAHGRRTYSALALALAVASGAAISGIALESPAYAQKKAKAPKASYSKEFVAVYQPLATDASAEGADAQAIKARIPGLLAVTVSEDEKLAAGQMAYNTGLKAQDAAMQRQGLEMMIASGKIDPARVGSLLFAAGQFAQNANEFAVARDWYGKAAAAGYAADDVQAMISESYFAEDNVPAGLDVLDKAIEAKVAASQPVPENWVKRGLGMAYNAGLGSQAAKYGALYAKNFPSPQAWGDAIAIQRNLFNYEDQEMLDLMRLAQRTGSMRAERDYIEYISAADPRRLPGEVGKIIDAGIAAGMLKANDVFVTDARSTSSSRIAADRADLPKLDRDARASGASGVTAQAAGDVFLSYGDAVKAEELYTIALTRPGIDIARVQTRLGIAQLDQGKFAEAQASFAKVQGQRQSIANLWSVYAGQKAQ